MARGYDDNSTVQELNYEWKIKNFEELSKKNDSSFYYGAVSEEFSSSGPILKRNTWKLCLYFNNREHSEPESKKWISLLLKLTVPFVRKVIVDGSFYVLDKNNERVMIKNLRKTFVAGIKNGDVKFIEKSKLLEQKDELLTDGTLTVGLEALVYDINVSPGLPLVVEKNQIVDDIRKLYHTKEGFDIVIKVENEKFKAHRVLLLARSSVFSKIFVQENISGQKDEIFIPDIKADAMEKLLEYIYTDQVTDLDEIAKDLIEAAQKFQLTGLTHICEASISKFLSAKNALRTLAVAERTNSKKLTDNVMNFIVINATEVFNSNEYNQWQKEDLNPGLFLFKHFADFNKRKNA